MSNIGIVSLIKKKLFSKPFSHLKIVTWNCFLNYVLVRISIWDRSSFTISFKAIPHLKIVKIITIFLSDFYLLFDV